MRHGGSAKQRIWLGPSRYFCGCGRRIANTDTDSKSKCNTYSDGNSDRDSCRNTDAYSNSDGDRNSDTNTNAYSYCHPYSYFDA